MTDPASRASVETVLVVDDQRELVSLIESLLGRRGYRVVTATSAAAARAVAQQLDTVDLLLTDLVMPDVAGRELAEELCERWEGLRVVFMSGYTDGQLDGVSLPAGAAFLSKPFASSELYAMLDRVLGHDGAPITDARD